MSLTIRPATEHDVDAMYEISCAVHLSPLYRELIPASHYDKFLERYTPAPSRLANFYEKFVIRFLDPAWHVWVAELNGVVTGFTVAHDQEEVLTLKSLFVSEEYQGKGIGKALFMASCEIARPGQTILLEVIENNHRAIGLYERAGFQRGPDVSRYYGAPMMQMYKLLT